MVDTGLLTPGVGADDPDDIALVRALLRAEVTWVQALESVGQAQSGAGAAIERAAAMLTEDDDEATRLATSLAADAAKTGNPVISLVAALRDAAPAEYRDSVHQGLTSQDTMDTALMLVLTDAATAASAALTTTGRELTVLAQRHKTTAVLARTLGQAALPTTLGARIAGWLQALAEAHARLEHEMNEAPLAFGGAVGTLAGTHARAGASAPDPFAAVEAWAAALGLRSTAGPWHVTRFPVERFAGAFAEVCAASGKIAADVLVGARPEVGELREHAEPGKGASSIMPFKSNPVLSITLRRCAMTAPHHLAQVHAAAGLAGDERPDGAWHAEWAALRDLARESVIASRSVAALVAGLEVDAAAAARNLADHGNAQSDTGSAEAVVDRVIERYGYGA